MVSKVTRSPGADSSGIFRRPRLVLKLKRFEDIPMLLGKTKSYPTPIRMVGADYSQTRCVGGDGGTTVDTGALDKILEYGETFVRAQAGVRVSTLVQALAERGQELPLTPEMGQISLGAVAVTTLPQASYAPGVAQLSSLVSELKLITPQGKQMIVSERERDLMRVLRSSFGLLGVVHEVVLRVRPPDRGENRLPGAVAQGFHFPLRVHHQCAGGVAASHLPLQRSDYGRTADARRISLLEPIRNLADSKFSSCAMSCRLSAPPSGSVLAAPGLRAVMLSSMQRALRATQGRSTRGVVMYAHEWMRDMPAEAWKARHTYSLWAFPQADYPKVLAEYFTFCKTYFKENRYRCNVVSGSSRLHQDRGSLFSASYSGPMFTLEPSSTGDKGWDDFLIDFNDFASGLGGTPTFNQTKAPAARTCEQVIR